MNTNRLLAFFSSRRDRGEPLVLASVVETGGSTYSKVGDLLLVDVNGVVCGMLSGGCLENDLAVRAQAVIETGVAQLVSYELGGDDDEIWGLGTGCDGLMRVFLQPVTATSNYSPLSDIEAALQAGEGAQFVIDDPALAAPVELRIPAAPRVLIVGLGADAEPLARNLDQLGFRCDLVDHRPALIDAHRFPASCQLHHVEMAALADTLDLDRYAGAIVMTHQLVNDRACLAALATSTIDYIGLLGPAPRRERLLSELGDVADRLHDRVEGPAGVALGGRGPEAIALSITARLQQVISAAP